MADEKATLEEKAEYIEKLIEKQRKEAALRAEIKAETDAEIQKATLLKQTQSKKK